MFTLVLGACGQSEEQYLQAGRQAFLNGDVKTSAIQLKSLLQINPKQAEARFLLGQIYLGNGDGAAALLELERASNLGFNKTALLVPMGRAYLLSGRYDAVLQQPLENESLAVSDRAYLYSLRGYAYIEAKDALKAESAFEKALELQPNQEFALLGQIRLALAQGDLQAASERSERALGLSPESVDIFLLLGDIASLKGDRAGADASFTQALEYDPENFDALAKRALIRMAPPPMDGGLEDLDRLRKLAPNHPRTLYATGLYHYTLKEFPEAQAALEQLISKQPNHDRGMFLLGASNLALKNDEQGLQYLEQFIARNPGSMEATNQLVIAYLRRGDDGRAQKLLEAAGRLHAEDTRLFSLQALASLRKGKMTEALQLLRKAERLNPNSGDLQMAVGLSLLEVDQPESAIDALNRATALGTDSDLAKNIRVLAYLKAGDSEQALSDARDLAAQNQHSAMQQQLLGYVYFTMGRIEEAKAVYETVLALQPGDPAASHNLAVISRRGGSGVQARTLYEKVLEHHPDDVATLVRLGMLEISTGEGDAGVAHLRRVLELDQGNVDARLAVARHLFVSGSHAAATALLEDAPARIDSHPGVLVELAKMQVAAGETRVAADTLSRLTSKYPSLAAAWFQLGLLQEKIGERDAAGRSFAQAMRHRPKQPMFGASTARGLYRAGREDLANELLRSLLVESPDDLNVRLLQGWFEQQAGRQDAAVAVYLSVHEKQPSEASTLALAGAYSKSGQVGDGIGILQNWLERHPDDQKINIALAQLQINAGRPDEAVETLSQLLTLRPRDVGLMNDIAQLLRLENPDRALEFARRARALAPEHPAVMDTLGVLLLDTGEVQQSVELFTRAVAEQPYNPAMRLHLAQALVADGAYLRGRAELEQLLARYPDAPEREEAMALLERLSSQ